jgi:penicillin-binding protein 2
VIEKRKPKPGRNIQTTLLLSLQLEVTRILTNAARAGAAIVLDIKSGDILAMVSVPTFDPEIFTQKITQEQWQEVNNSEEPPLINRAISGLYAPGSTFKMVVALAALRAGIVDKSTTFFCPGYHDIKGRRFHCWRWRLGGHGHMNIVQALEQSCDVFFYHLAEKLDPARIVEAAKDLGVGGDTKIGLPFEKKAHLPALSRNGKLWLGQALNLSIGQGQLLMSPLHLVVMAASIASGRAVVPRIISSSKKAEFNKLPFSEEHLNIIRCGMEDVVGGKRGTARGIANKELDIAGKTGSTQVALISMEERKQRKINERPYHLKDHALFVGYAPTDERRFAVVVIVEHGESGGRVAAPIAKEILLAAKRITENESGGKP